MEKCKVIKMDRVAMNNPITRYCHIVSNRKKMYGELYDEYFGSVIRKQKNIATIIEPYFYNVKVVHNIIGVLISIAVMFALKM
jgi:hypothetical protein